MWGWDSTSHRSDSKTKTCSRHSLPWAPKGNFSNFLRKWQSWLGSEQSTLMSITKMALILSLTPSNVTPKYSILKRPRHETGAGGGGRIKGPDGWWHTDQKLLIPSSDHWKITKGLHDSLHLGRDAMPVVVFQVFTGKGLLETIKRVTWAYALCTTHNPGGNVKPPPRQPSPAMWDLPRRGLQIGFTQMPSLQGFKYLLVFTGTLTV